jgi:hypothetical protein
MTLVRPYHCLCRNHLTFVLDVISLVASILPLMALFQVFDGLSAVSGGILRARGKQVRFFKFRPWIDRNFVLHDSLRALC